MHIHLSKYDVQLLCDKANESFSSEDDGEAFCEEAVGCFEDADIETIESRAGGTADNFMMEIFEQWDGVDPIEVIESLAEMLGNLDIEVTFDDPDADEDDEEEEKDEDDNDGWETESLSEDGPPDEAF